MNRFLLTGLSLMAIGCVPEPPPIEWRYHSGDAGSKRFSPAAQIDSSNVSDLRMVWRWRAPDSDLHKDHYLEHEQGYENQSTPLMVGGVLYVSTPLNTIAALNAETGEQIWRFDNPDVWHTADYVGAHRGVTYWSDGQEERILFGTGTAYLYSLDAKTGNLDPQFGDGGRIDLTQMFDRPVERMALAITSPPVVCRDVVVAGFFATDWPWDGAPPEKTPPGDAFGFDVRTGERLWTFHPIPREGEFGTDTWENESWRNFSRVNVWTILSADDELGYIYLPFGNTNNEYYGGGRPGDNLFTSSLVCLNAETGQRVWHYQTMRHGSWNMDLPHAAILLDIVVDGEPIKAVAQLTKQAFCFVFDRITGEPVWPIEDRPVPASSAPGERMPATQPFPTKPAPFDRQGLSVDDVIDFTPEIRQETLDHIAKFDYGPLYTPPSERGTLMIPGAIGGANIWSGAAHPGKGWIYVASETKPSTVWIRERDNRPEGYGGRTRQEDGPRGLPLTKPPYGRITAIDLNTGDHRWMTPIGEGPIRHPDLRDLDLPPLGSATRVYPMATQTLLFAVTDQPFNTFKHRYGADYYIDSEPFLWVFDLSDGHLIHRLELPVAGSATPMSYAINGRQYIVVPLGDADTPPEYAAYALPNPGEKLPEQGQDRRDAEHPLFYEAVRAFDAGDSTAFAQLLQEHPQLARARGYLDPLYKYPQLRGATLLHHVAGEPMSRGELKGDVVSTARLLLDAGADPSATTIDSFGTLSLVYDSRQTGWLGIKEELMQLLLEAGADPDERRGYLLWSAVRFGQHEMASLLVANDATLDLRTAAHGSFSAMSGFFNEDGTLKATAHSGYRRYFPTRTLIPATPAETLTEALTLAARAGSADAVELLLNHGADIHSLSVRFNWPDDKGETPLHHAASLSHLEAVRVLLARGADPNRPNHWGGTPLNYAQWADDKVEDKQEIIRLLKEAAEQSESVDQASP